MSALEDLLAAIKRKDASAVTRALDADGELATARAASGQTPAIVAIYWRAPEMLALPAELACDGGHVALADDLDAAARRRAS